MIKVGTLKEQKNKMKILRRGKLTYYVKKEAVIVGISEFQHIAYTIYPLQNRKPFYDFRRKILNSKEDEYGNILDQIALAQKYGLKASAATKPKIEEEQ